MPSPRLLVIEGNSPQTLSEHIAVGGTPAHRAIPTCCANCCRARSSTPAIRAIRPPFADGESLEGYDGIAITGSSLHIYNGGPEVMRQIDLVRAALTTGNTGVRLVLGPASDRGRGRRQRAQKPKGPRDRFRPRHPPDRSRPQASDVCRQARRVQCADRASRRDRSAAARHHRARHQCDVGGAERRSPHQRIGRLGRAIPPGISAARSGGDRAPHRRAADRRGLLRRCRRHEGVRAGSRHARPRSRLQAARLAARHQRQHTRQEIARRRDRQLGRIPGAADAGEAGRG